MPNELICLLMDEEERFIRNTRIFYFNPLSTHRIVIFGELTAIEIEKEKRVQAVTKTSSFYI